MKRFSIFLALVIACYFQLLPVATAASIINLGAPVSPYTRVSVTGVSDDGSVVVGELSKEGASGIQREAFRWTQSGGYSLLGDFSGGLFTSRANDVSSDGSIIVGRGYSGGGQAFRWNQTDGMVSLGDLPGSSIESSANAVSDDGSIIVGRGTSSSGEEAMYWTQATGLVALGDVVYGGGSYNSSAYDVSDDGHVIVGVTGSGWAFRWTPQSGMDVIAQTPGSSGAYGVSGDGSVVIGYYNPDQFHGSNNAFRWTQETGVVLLGDLPTGSNTSVAYDVSNDGNVIVGYGSIQVSSGTTQRAFYWDSNHGMRYLKDVLANDFEIDLTGWDNLFQATAISNDGTKIVGMGSYNGFSRAFLVDLATVPEVPSFLIVGGVCLVSFGISRLSAPRRISKVL